MSELAAAEALLLAAHRTRAIEDAPAVFVLGAPRTGSTLLYQLLAHCCESTPLTNLVNGHFAEHPALGIALGERLRPLARIEFTSSYGKTRGPLGPSEASAVFRHWFGNAEPSALHSVVPLPGKEVHIQDTVRAIDGLTGRPLLAKNAWNCFRAAELARILPASRFVWIRRDVAAAAVSDLESRYRRGGPDVWNSATPANYEEIRRRPYWEQVVEQQVAFCTAVERDLHAMPRDRWSEVWYEDLCAAPDAVLERLAVALGTPRSATQTPPLAPSRGPALPDGDRERIEEYVAGARASALARLRYPEGEPR